MLYGICDNDFLGAFTATSFNDAMDKYARAMYYAQNARNPIKRPIWKKRANCWKRLASDIRSCRWCIDDTQKTENTRKPSDFNLGMAWPE